MNIESEVEEMKKVESLRKFSLRILHLILFLDMLAVGLVVPLLPYYGLFFILLLFSWDFSTNSETFL